MARKTRCRTRSSRRKAAHREAQRQRQQQIDSEWQAFAATLSPEDRAYFEATDRGNGYHDRLGNHREELSDTVTGILDWVSPDTDPDVSRRSPVRPTTEKAYKDNRRPSTTLPWADSDTPAEVREVRIEFLDRYLDRLPVPQRDILHDRTGSMETFAAMAAADGRSKSTQAGRFQTAVRSLIYLIAQDSPEFATAQQRHPDGRAVRDYAAELAAAITVAAKAGVLP